jgi:hypothetical protein
LDSLPSAAGELQRLIGERGQAAGIFPQAGQVEVLS